LGWNTHGDGSGGRGEIRKRKYFIIIKNLKLKKK
jgi:hypothetical protein